MGTTGRRGLTFDEMLAEAAARALAPPAEPVALADLSGRVLAEDVRARSDHPGFTNSAMDGYAVRAADAAAGAPLRLVGESRAGAPFAGSVGPGEATVISTGAEIPAGADAVLRREDAEEDAAAGTVRATVPPPAGAFVRPRGEDLRAGAVVLPAGAVVRAHEVAVVAGAGHARVACVRRPRVAILGSGDEVVPAGARLLPGQVYDANRPGIAAQAAAAGAEVVANVLVPDDRDATIAAVGGALDGSPRPDLLVTIGGVSMGRHDHLRPALADAGVAEILFGIEIRPGHPLWLGRRGPQLVLGLPGNPVSAAVCFHAFGRPLLGRAASWERRLPLAAGYAKDTPRTELIRVVERDGRLHPLPRQASNHITSLAGATHLAVIEAGVRTARAGDLVRCCPLA
ncbi:MAG: molybdopterin molybdotransferase MoeA [Thermoleophilia bacterium]